MCISVTKLVRNIGLAVLPGIIVLTGINEFVGMTVFAGIKEFSGMTVFAGMVVSGTPMTFERLLVYEVSSFLECEGSHCIYIYS